MNKIISTILLISSISIVNAQPEAVNIKDLNEKINRADITSDDAEHNTKLQNIMPVVDIPLIDFNEKPAVVNGKSTEIKKSKKTTTKVAKKTKLAKSSKVKKRPLLIAKRPMGVSRLQNNDKIVINKGKTHVYRMTESKVVKYKFNGSLPLTSLGLKASGSNSYYVIDKLILINDAKQPQKTVKKVRKTYKTKRAQRTQRTQKTKRPITKKKPEKTIKADIDSNLTTEEAEKRKQIEAKHNHGKQIKKSIKLKDLRVNDEIYVIDGLQFIIRKNKGTSGVKKYWLIETIDTNSKSIVKENNFKYKVIKPYKLKL